MKQIFMLFLLWAALASMTFVVCTFTFSTAEYDNLATRGLQVEAIVEKKEPDNHQNITYSYIVDGRRYTGIGPADHGNPPFESIKTGQKIIAYYDSSEPQKSIPGEPKSYGKGNRSGIYFFTIFAPLLIIFGLYRKTKKIFFFN
ncbi:MAG TPA: hypothetical protein VGC76_00710 [Pyrinomonadaceae bacterium]